MVWRPNRSSADHLADPAARVVNPIQEVAMSNLSTAITPYGVAIRTAIASGNLDALKVALSLAQELYARDGDVRSAVHAARAAHSKVIGDQINP